MNQASTESKKAHLIYLYLGDLDAKEGALHAYFYENFSVKLYYNYVQ